MAHLFLHIAQTKWIYEISNNTKSKTGALKTVINSQIVNAISVFVIRNNPTDIKYKIQIIIPIVNIFFVIINL